jgi:pilus assembly protein CpaE
MPNPPRILIVTPDAALREELVTTIATLGPVAPIVQLAASLRQGIEAARNRPPEFIILEMTSDAAALRNFVAGVSSVAPAAHIVAALRPDGVANGETDSAAIIQAIRTGIHDFLRRPISSVELTELLGRRYSAGESTKANEGCVVSFISNKGGVGKSTLAVNVAVGLALRHPQRVLLVDASLQMGVAASMLNLQPQVTLADIAREQNRLDDTMFQQMLAQHESGLYLLPAPADAVEAAEVDDETMSRVITIARRLYDYVVIDTFPVFDRVVLAVLDLSDRAYVVIENVVPTVQGAAKLLHVLDDIGFPAVRQRIVLNRMTNVAGGLTADDVAQRLDAEIDFRLPYDGRIITAANTGHPMALRSPRFWEVSGRFLPELRRLIADAESLRPNSIAGAPSSNGHGPPMPRVVNAHVDGARESNPTRSSHDE